MEYMDAKKIVINTKHLNWDYLAFEYAMNIYWGCSHGCIYCYARSDYYDKIGKLNGDFNCIRAKKNALEIIRDDLQRKTKKGVVFTDIYLSTQVTMADGQREYFYREAEKYFPGIAEKYIEKYQQYYYCRSPRAKSLWNTFAEECEKENINCNMRLANQLIRSGYNIPVIDGFK